MLAKECVLATGDDADRRWKSLTALGNVLRADERYAPALDAHVSALQIALARGHAAHTVMSWNNLGVIFLTASAWDLAIECFSRVTENPALVRAWQPYSQHTNLALCHLQLGSMREGLLAARQALRIETPEIIARNHYTYVALRLTFVQLALQGNRVHMDDIRARAREARDFAAAHDDSRTSILSDLIAANLEFAYGERSEGLAAMKGLLLRARKVPQVMSDVLFSLLQAEKLAGNTFAARTCVDEWSEHLFPEGESRAKAMLDIQGWLPAGKFLRDHLRELELEPEVLPPLPASILELIGGRAP